MDEELLTTTQAAAIAGVTKQTIYIAAVRGRIPHQVVNGSAHRAAGGGTTLLIRRADLDAYIAARDARRITRATHAALTGAERARRHYQKKREQGG